MRLVRHSIPSFAVAIACLFAVGTGNQVVGQTAQDAPATDKAASLERVSKAIEYLASDELEGRGPNTKGLEVAGDYLVDEYKDIGLKPLPDGTFKQSFSIPMGRSFSEDTCKLVLSGSGENVELELDKDFSPKIGRRSTNASGEIVFVGYGVNSEEHNYNEYKDVDVTDKWVIVIRKEPQQKNEDSVFNGADISEHSYTRTKIQAAREAGAAGILFVNDSITADETDDQLNDDRAEFTRGTGSLPFAHVTRKVVNELLEKSPIVAPDGTKLTNLNDIEKRIDEKLEPLSAAIDGWSADYVAEVKTKMVEIFNVVGMLEGKGPNKDEIVVVGGHYDHLGYGGYGSMAPGRNEIHNGADDNATGTIAIVELARRYAARGKAPNRTYVFVCFSGEERGLHGSQYYVNNPPWELERTVAMINFDMIGYLRNNNGEMAGPDDTGNLDLIHGGSSDAFDAIFGKAAGETNLSLNIGRRPQRNSDHFPFYQKNIPDVFIHTGLTRVLHTPDDDYNLLNMDGCLRVIDFTEKVMDGLDALEQRPQFVELGRGGTQTRLRSSIGVQLDFEAEAGPTVTKVTEGGAAAKAGIKVNDVLVYFNSSKVTSRTSVYNLLRTNDPGTKVEVKLKRDGEMKTIELELGDR